MRAASPRPGTTVVVEWCIEVQGAEGRWEPWCEPTRDEAWARRMKADLPLINFKRPARLVSRTVVRTEWKEVE